MDDTDWETEKVDQWRRRGLNRTCGRAFTKSSRHHRTRRQDYDLGYSPQKIGTMVRQLQNEKEHGKAPALNKPCRDKHSAGNGLSDTLRVLNIQKPRRIDQEADENRQPDEIRSSGSQPKSKSDSLSSYDRFYSVLWPLHEDPGGTTWSAVSTRTTQVNKICPSILSKDIGGNAGKIYRKTVQDSQNELCPAAAQVPLSRVHISALGIQAFWRGYVVRRMLMTWTAAATLIQFRYRALRHVRREQAAQVLQCCFRAWAQKRRYRETVSNMCKIQAVCWANEARGNFERERKAVLTIQSESLHFVAYRRVQGPVQPPWQCSDSARVIQANWRGYLTRRILKTRFSAAAVIQSWVRGHLQRRKYKGLKHRIHDQIQAWRQIENIRRVANTHSTRIQACWRGHVVKSEFKKMVRATKTIQRTWRFLVALRKGQLIEKTIRVESCIRIQARWRGFVARRNLYLLNQAATKIQRGWRQLVAHRIRHTHSARIQACWRGHIAKCHFKKVVQATKTIQLAWRFLLALQRSQLTEKTIKIESSIRTQARWRGLVARRNLHLLNQAATRIQRGWRHTIDHKKSLVAAMSVKDVWARQVGWSSRIPACKRGDDNWQQLQARCMRFQAQWQKLAAWQQVDQQNRAAGLIQREWLQSKLSTRTSNVAALAVRGRGPDHMDLAMYSTLDSNGLASQICKYGCHQLHSFQLLQEGPAAIIQVRELSCLSRGSVYKIEPRWTAQSCQRQFPFYRSSGKKVINGVTQFEASPPKITEICRIGEEWKTTSVDHLAFRGRQANTVSIQDQQALFYGPRSAVEYQTSSKKELKLRGSNHGDIVFATVESACDVQQRHQHHEAVLLLQVREKGDSNSQESESEPSTAVILTLEHENMKSGSSQLREEQAESENLQVFKKVVCSGDVLQSLYRCAAYIGFILTQTPPIITIQMQEEYGKFLMLQFSPDRRSSAIASTASARTICRPDSERSYLPAFLDFAPDINKDCPARKHITLNEEPVTDLVDNLTRCCAETVLDRSSLALPKLSVKELNAANVTSSWCQTFSQRTNYVRLGSFAVVIQRHVRGRINRSRFAQIKASAILLQTHWRGYLVRRGQSHPQTPWRELRQRIRTNAAGVQDSARLYNRLAESLSKLLREETVSGILNTCRTLDVASQYSYKCCEQLAEIGAINTILLLIQRINRSPPLEQVLKHALSILSNLARHSALATRLAQYPAAISIISEQLYTFRNDEGIFLQAMSLLQKVCKTSAGIEVLQREPSIVRRFFHIAQSLEGHMQADKRSNEAADISLAWPEWLREVARNHPMIMLSQRIDFIINR